MPTPCSVTGTLQTLTSGKIAQGQVLFQLVNLGIGNPIGITGTSILPALNYVAMTAQDGTFSISLWGNDAINPTNTLYAVTYRDYLRNEMGPILYSITGASANLNSLAAQSTTLPPVFITGPVTLGTLTIAPITQNASFTASTLSAIYLVTTGTSAIIATLPSVVALPGQTLIIKKVDAGTGTVTLMPNGSQKIDGLATFILSAQFQYIGLVSDGANWQIFTRN